MADAGSNLEKIIQGFSIDRFKDFFREKSDLFVPEREEINFLDSDDFKKGKVLGEINFSQTDKVLIVSFEVNNELSDRSGKKKQYEKAKEILKKYRDSSAGIFIFYDKNGSFRFSLVYPQYFGTKRDFSLFKRFTFFVTANKTNRTFLSQIGEGDFTSLKTIKEAFSVEPVTKEFYKEIQNWFFYAKDKVFFPEDYPYSNKDERVSLNLIRLITRVIFIWFMKEKHLIPELLFDESKLGKIVKDFKKNSNYYNAILQNLFFATLNQKKEERGWAENENFLSNRKNYGIKTLYRYEDLFLVDKTEVMEIFKDVPFINGGIFDCLDKENDEGKVIYIDGFSRTIEKRAKIADSLFFSEGEQWVNLSGYGFSSSEPVRGLIDILKTYNFTVDENSSIDQEIALDPELLGRVFENLLACYNPETQTTARRSTGSYYTPREIVEFMVMESIFNYLKTKLPQMNEEDLRILVSNSDEPKEIEDNIKEEILKALDELKILDPACGSGAFPMGVLHRIVFILQKIDPNNEKWKEIQFNKALLASKEAFSSNKDKKERENILKEINETFDENINYPDYGRKIYLIENCIYGVDIQPIATEISRLRFFISLLIDQKVDRNRENCGIRPLPNLETKFVSANTLIELEDIKKPLLIDNKVNELFEELKNTRHRTFSAKSRTQKHKLQEKESEIRKKIVNELKEGGWAEEKAEKIARFDIYDHNATADWFDPKWMFGVEDGFDILIGNPPYIQLQNAIDSKLKVADLYKNQNYQTFERTGDIYCLFYEKGMQLIKTGGILTFITSNKWMRAGYGEKLREFFSRQNPLVLVDLGPNVFESATVDTNIIFIQKAQNQNQLLATTITESKKDNINIAEYIKQNAVTLRKLSKDAWFIGSDAEQQLKEKIERLGKPLKEWDVNIYYGIKTGLNEAFIITTEKRNEILANCRDEDERRRTEAIIKPILRGRDIKRYYYEWAGLWVIGTFPALRLKIDDYPALKKYFLENFDIRQLEQSGIKYPTLGFDARKKTGNKWFETQDQIAYYPEFEKEKVVWKALGLEPAFAYVPQHIYNNDKANILTSDNLSIKFLVGFFNSKLFQWIFSNIGINMGQGFEYKIQFMEKIPLPPITPASEPIVRQIESLVDKILAAKKQNKNADTSQLEKQIDQLVYKLYDLTDEEIKIIEGEK